MKKFFCSLGFLFSLLFFAACGEATVSITLPSSFVSMSGNINQASCNQFAAEKGYESVTLNEDGTLTYVMKKSKHQEELAELAATIDESLKDMISSGEYPNFVSITAKDDYTKFDILTKGTDLDFMESFAAMGLCMCGQFYQFFNGTPEQVIYVQYINEQTGEVIHESNSNEMQ